MAEINGTYRFETFDFEAFAEGKRFILVSATKRKVYDEQKKKYTDEIEGVNLEVEIASDEMEYNIFGKTEKGVNSKVRFKMYVDDEDANIEDYLALISDDSFAPKEIFISEVTDARIKEVKQGNKKPF
ncbi:hypothetical protein BUZ77_12780, partial [Staphylococcus saprophyticus]|uniref:hypothetical protein n=1 Tax=Staphylococcus saprophyticus TaxID=29385 RepID=UPI000D422F1C